MKSLHKVSIFVAILFFLASSLGMGWLGGALAKNNAVGAVPSVVNYQGFLSGAGGLPYNGAADFTFSIYDADTGGTQLWTEAQAGVTVSNGFFSVLLGSANPLTASVFSATTHYLEMQVDTGAGLETLSRQALASVPFSLRAEYADAATYADSAGIAGSASSMDWIGLTSIPAGFADGIDDTGLTSFPLIFSRTTVDYANQVGYSSSIAIGVDGFGIISHVDYANSVLRITHCLDVNCTQSESFTIDSSNAYPYGHTSIAIGVDGLGLVSFQINGNGDLKVAHCNDIPCSSASLYTLDNTGYVGFSSSLAIGADGLGLISYLDGSNGDLKVAHCNDTVCSSATTSTLDSGGDVGYYTDIVIGADGLGLISYYDYTNGNLKVAHCYDLACGIASAYTLDSTGSTGVLTSIAIGGDGLGLISYLDETNYNLKVAHCNNTACSSANIVTVDYSGTVGYYSSIAVGPDGLGLISYSDGTNSTLKVLHCGNANCDVYSSYVLDSIFIQYSSIAIGADGLGLISYQDVSFADLKVIHCDEPLCSP